MFTEAKLFHKAGEGSGGGSDPHNLGYYADLTALQTAHPTGTDGDFAILGSTDTIWVWDSGTSAWKDTDTKGQVTSVNNKTGTVTLAAADVDAVPQYDTMPTASVSNWTGLIQYSGATDSTYTKGYFYQNVRTITSASGSVTFSPASVSEAVVTCSNSDFVTWLQVQTNTPELVTSGTIAYSTSTRYIVTGKDTSNNTVFSKEIYRSNMIGAGFTFTSYLASGDVVDFTCSVSVDAATYAWEHVSEIPVQTGHEDQYLTTNGTTLLWSGKVPLYNYSGATTSVGIVSYASYPRSVTLGKNCQITPEYGQSTAHGVAIGYQAQVKGLGGIAIGTSATDNAYGAKADGGAIAIGNETVVTGGGIAIGNRAQANTNYAIQLGPYNTNNDTKTFKVSLGDSSANNYELLSPDGTIPTARLTKANTTVTLAVADWSSSTQTVSVTGVTATSIVLVAPDSASQSDYTSAGILCTAQGAGTLTFTCSTTPTNAITVNVVAL